MKDWVPLLQVLPGILWPIAILFLAAVIFRKPILGILNEIKRRISEGSGFEAGPSGVKLSQIQQLTVPQILSDKSQSKEDNSSPTQPPRKLYLVHTSRRDEQTTAKGEPYYQLRIYLDGDSEEDLTKVKKVVYHLHPTFPIPIQTRIDKRTNFEVRTKAWGEFNLWAEVFLEGENEPIILERYLNL